MAPLWILFAAASFVLVGALMVAWESLRGGGARLSPRALSSALYYFVNQGLIAPLLAAGFVMLDEAIDPMAETRTWSASQIVVAILFFEAVTYAIHRLAHHVRFLYRLHRVHHEGKDLHWMDAFRQHPVEYVLFQGLGNLPAVILFGAAGHVSLWINVALRLVTAWLHARGPVSLGPMEYVLTSPSMHHVHHGRGARHNYGGVLSIFDWIGRTARRPALT